MGLSEKLQYLITVDSAGAVKGFQNVGKSAEKELGKAEDRIDKVGARMTKFGAGALASAGVLGAGLFKTANAFQDLAIESGKLANTTGLTVDAASRMIEVAGDLGIETATVESSLNKMNRTLGSSPALFEKYGVEIAKAADGTTDVNATFLNVVNRLNAIQDPAQRATAATALLGKGWTGMSELIATGSASLSQSLASVSDAKVINPDELAKAKDYRASMDALGDSFQDLVISIGQGAAPALGNLAQLVSVGVGAFSSLDAVTGGLAGELATFGVAGLGAAGAASSVVGQLIKMRDTFSTIDAATGVRSLTTLGTSLGVVGGAIGIAAIAYGVYSDRKREAEQRTTDLAGALLGEASAQNEALAELANNDKGTKRFLESQKALKLETADLTQYIQKGTGAAGDIVRAWDAATAAADGTYPTLAAFATQLGLGADVTYEQIAALRDFVYQLDDLREGEIDRAETQALVNDVTGQGVTATQNAADAAGDLANQVDGKTTPALEAIATSTDRAKEAAQDLEEAWSDLKGEVDDDQAWLNLQDQFDNVRQAAADAWFAAASGAADADEEQRNYQQSLNDMKLGVIAYADEVLGLPPERVTKLLVNAQDIDAVEQQLAIMTRNRTISVELVKKGAIGWDVWVDPNGNRINARAAGGHINAGDPYLVGERGPELIVPATSGTVIPAARTQSIMAETGTAAGGMTLIVQGSIFGDQALRQTFADIEREQRWKARVAG